MLPAQPGRIQSSCASLLARTFPSRPRIRIAARSTARAAASCRAFWWLALLGGCGAPGEPTPPSPPIPAAIVDLTARQSGDGALLSFTLPGKTITGKRLTETPACEIFRGTVRTDGSADAKSFHMVYAIPSAMVANYVVEKHVEFLDPIAPEETKTHPGGKVAYLVRTRISPKKSSLDSNVIEVAIFPVPQRIASVDARVTEDAIEISWPAVAQTSGGTALDNVSYRIYRGQLPSPTDQATSDAVSKDLVHARWKSPLTLLASPTSNSYRDTDFTFDETYVYVVRTAALAHDGVLESADSAPTIVTPKDTFPPSAPRGLVAAVLEGNGTAPVVDLSWSISPETDVAGYRVYRSEGAQDRGGSITSELVPTPAFRDTSVQPGHSYRYSVTALDRAGNESPPSAPTTAELAPSTP
jgi:Fibronectin type III domain